MEIFQAEGTPCSKAKRQQAQGRVGGGAGNLVCLELRLKIRLDPKKDCEQFSECGLYPEGHGKS